MNLPKPFGMRWFGIFVAALVLGTLLDAVLPRGFGALVYASVVVGTGLLMTGLSELSGTIKLWMLDNW